MDTLAAEEEIMTDVLDENLLKAERAKIENWYARHHDPRLQIVFFDVKKIFETKATTPASSRSSNGLSRTEFDDVRKHDL